MREAYFHAMIEVQNILSGDQQTGRVFVSNNPTTDQWILAPTPVDLGEGTALALPPGKKAMGIGVADGGEIDTPYLGTVPVNLTVTLTAPAEPVSDTDPRMIDSFFVGKRYSEMIGLLGGRYEEGVEPMGGYMFFKDHCDIPPEMYGLLEEKNDLRDTRVTEYVPEGGENYRLEDDIWVFWRNFTMVVELL